MNEIRAFVNLVDQLFIISLRTHTTKSAFGAQEDRSALCPYEGMHFEYSGVNRPSPVRADFQELNRVPFRDLYFSVVLSAVVWSWMVEEV